MDITKQTFKLVKGDVFNVLAEHIVAVLKYPKIEGIGDNIKYKFSYSVDVQEA